MHSSQKLFGVALALGAAIAAGACGGSVENPALDGGSTGAGPSYGGTSSGGYAGGVVGGGGGVGGIATGGFGGTAVGGAGGIATGGFGGTAVGGGGGISTGGFGGSFGGCGGCPTFTLDGILPLPACCAPDGSCGSVIDPSTAKLINAVPGCYLLNQPGAPDSSCPPFYFTNPITQQPSKFAGCCQASTQTCAYQVDLSSVQGPNFGCTDLSGGAGASGQGCGQDACLNCVQAKCSGELAACASNTNCLSIIQCAQQCTSSACVDKCRTSWPAGMPAFDSIVQCETINCGTVCN